MTIVHHPADELLLSYAAGATHEAVSLIVATHLALCPVCRRSVAMAEAAGGAMLEDCAPVPLDGDALDTILARLGDPTTPKSVSKHTARVPEPLRSYIGGDLDTIRWMRVTKGLAFRPVKKSGHIRANLIRSKAGHTAGMHTHRGEELTLVLTGGYTDETGRYGPGDLQSATPQIMHRPVADEGEDCIALVVSDAPKKFRNFGAGLIARLCGF